MCQSLRSGEKWAQKLVDEKLIICLTMAAVIISSNLSDRLGAVWRNGEL